MERAQGDLDRLKIENDRSESEVRLLRKTKWDLEEKCRHFEEI